ncbi:hypothetical protein [Marininema halotolerans]|uniref:hypothetical protein n=1 Tax=Marininema halotolerans TaxID=1155944 RepID=UPI00159582B5|nr:hypothetical protein [Marininema halotolerans]
MSRQFSMPMYANYDHRVATATVSAKRTAEYGYDYEGNLTTVTKKDTTGKRTGDVDLWV